MIHFLIFLHVIPGAWILWLLAKVFVNQHESRVYNRFLKEYQRRVRERTLTRQEAVEFMTEGTGSPENWRHHARRWEYK